VLSPFFSFSLEPSLENKNTQIAYHTNKAMFDKMNFNHKVNLFEQSNLLDEENIIGDID
jgi:hypothetical protein